MSTSELPSSPLVTHPGRRGFHPEAFGKYYLLDRIAVGGMAEVFRAKTFGHSGFEKVLVIKRILSPFAEDPDFVSMFVDEARLCAQLSHPNITQIYDFGKVGTHWFIAMEAVDGRDLKSVMRRLAETGEHMPIDVVIYIAHEVAKGLDYAHRRLDAQGRPLGVVHRDISPSNILLSFEGGVKVVDFGIAKAAGHRSGSEAGVLKGKFQYMSPEQALALDVDRRTDIFSLGICLWEMLTGQRLFRGSSDTETLELVKACQVPAPSLYNPACPPELDRICLRALAPQAGARYPDAAAMQRELQDVLLPSTPDRVAPRAQMFFQSRFADEIRAERDRLDRATRVASELHFGGEADLDLEDEVLVTRPMGAGPISPAEHGPTTSTVRPARSVPPPSATTFLYGLIAVVLAAVALWLARPFFLGTTPEFGTLEVTVLPATLDGVEIQLDGAPIPAVYDRVAAGEPHLLRIRAPGYITKERTVEIGPGDVLAAELELERDDGVGTPAPADVPTDSGTLASKGQPEPRRTGPPPVTEAAAAASTPTQSVPGPSATPEPSASAASTVRFESLPSSARVFVDGRRIGQTPLEWTEAKPGRTYNVEYRLDGHQSVQAVLEGPAAGELVTLSRSLDARAEAPTGGGKLSVQATPGWVKVFIDGEYVSTTPLFEHALPAGTHEIRLVNERQGIDRVESVTIVGGEVTRKAYQLQP